jgi:hypothetical protein
LIYPISRKQWDSILGNHSLKGKYLTMEHLRLAHEKIISWTNTVISTNFNLDGGNLKSFNVSCSGSNNVTAQIRTVQDELDVSRR